MAQCRMAPTTDRDWSAIGPSTHFFVTDGQKRDYLSRNPQCARGATKNSCLSIMLTVMDEKLQISLEVILLSITLTFRRCRGG